MEGVISRVTLLNRDRHVHPPAPAPPVALFLAYRTGHSNPITAVTHFLLSLRRYATAWEVNRQSTGTGRATPRRAAPRGVLSMTSWTSFHLLAVASHALSPNSTYVRVRVCTTCLTYVPYLRDSGQADERVKRERRRR